MAGNWCFCDEFCKLPQKTSGKFWESLYKLSKKGILKAVSKRITTGFSSMVTGIVVFSTLVIGVVEWSPAAVPVSGGSSGSGGTVNSGGSTTTSNGTTGGTQNTGAAKNSVQTNGAGQGQSQSFNQSESKAKTQTQQTTKKQVQKSKAKVTVRNTINAAQRANRVRSVVSSSRRPAIVRTRVSPNVGRSMRLTLRMRQPVTRFTGGGRAPAINAHTHSRFERGTKKVKEGRGK